MYPLAGILRLNQSNAIRHIVSAAFRLSMWSGAHSYVCGEANRKECSVDLNPVRTREDRLQATRSPIARQGAAGSSYGRPTVRTLITAWGGTHSRFTTYDAQKMLGVESLLRLWSLLTTVSAQDVSENRAAFTTHGGS